MLSCFTNYLQTLGSFLSMCPLQVIAVARTADLVLMMLDATKPYVHRQLLEKELESVGIRLNKKKPNIYFKVWPFLITIWWMCSAFLITLIRIFRWKRVEVYHSTRHVLSLKSMKRWFKWSFTSIKFSMLRFVINISHNLLYYYVFNTYISNCIWLV